MGQMGQGFAKVGGASLAALLLVAAPPSASADDVQKTRMSASRPLYVTQAPIILLKDMETGTTLFSRGADKHFAPASMAKVMTAYVVIDMIAKGELSRDKQFTMTEAVWEKWNGSTGGSTMFLRPGEKLSVDSLLKGLITVSGNDAAGLLAVGIDGTEEDFVQRMNTVATDLGMTSSRFGNPAGWPDGGRTKVNAADLVLLADRLIRKHPADYDRYFSIPRLQHGKAPDGTPIVQKNRNPILGRFAGADGLKTGHTAEAGYCFLGSAKRGGRRMSMVVAGMTSEKARRDEAERVMTWGFDQWEDREVLPAGTRIGQVDVGKGEVPIVAAETGAAFRLVVPKGYSGGYRAVMRMRAPLTAPIQRGTAIADLTVTADGLPSQSVPLFASADVANGGLWSRTRRGFYRLTGL